MTIELWDDGVYAIEEYDIEVIEMTDANENGSLTIMPLEMLFHG